MPGNLDRLAVLQRVVLGSVGLEGEGLQVSQVLAHPGQSLNGFGLNDLQFICSSRRKIADQCDDACERY